MLRKVTLALLAVLACVNSIDACTSMIVSAKASATGRPLLWKHRDTGCPDNFIERVDATDNSPAYVGLYNAGDSALSEAWMGFNEWGFAIMNTASYNLAPDTAKYKDREAEVMTRALRTCRTVDDFASLLDALPRPMGIQANFGVIDAEGHGAYFEANDVAYKRFDVDDEPSGVIVRTNYSVSGNDTDGFGYIRYMNVYQLVGNKISNGQVHPFDLTETLSRSFYNSLTGCNYNIDGQRWIVDQDFIPRSISTASCVVEGIHPGEDPKLTMMWAALGYPPASHVDYVTIDRIPDALRPLQPNGHSLAADQANQRKAKAFAITRGSGPHYIDMDYLRPIIAEQRTIASDIYRRGYMFRKLAGGR